METITLEVEEGKLSVLLAFLETLNYVKVTDAPTLSEKGKAFLDERLKRHEEMRDKAQSREAFMES